MNPLQSYLVSLGFAIDQNGFQRFMSVTSGGRLAVMALGSAVAATAAAILSSTHRIALGYEDLFYAAQRTSNTVLGLQSTSYGLRQVGLSADVSRSAIEGFARALNLQPGLSALAGGRAGQENVDRMLATVQRLQRMGRPGTYGFAVASQFADLFGIPYEVLTRTPEQISQAIKAREEYARMAKQAGIDAAAASDKFVKFEQSVNHLQSALSILAERMAIDWVGAAKTSVEWIDTLVQKFTILYDQKPVDPFAAFKSMAGGGVDLTSWRRRIRRAAGLSEDPPAKPTQAVPGAETGMPKPPARQKVMPSSKVWGDDEAVAAGLYDPPAAAPRLGSKSTTVNRGGDRSVTLNQPTTITVTTGSNASPREISEQIMSDQERLKASFGDLVRNGQGATR